jgi:hypothetical protein
MSAIREQLHFRDHNAADRLIQFTRKSPLGKEFISEQVFLVCFAATQAGRRPYVTNIANCEQVCLAILVRNDHEKV